MTLTFAGVTLAALGPAYVKWAFPIFVASAVSWMFNGALTKNEPQVITQAVLFTINLFAVIRWFT